jgi:hypothetical protein
LTSPPPRIDAVLGRHDARTWEDYQVKGNLLAARPRYVREQWGEEAVRDVSSRLDTSVRQLFDRAILPFSWYSFSDLAAIDKAIVQGPMGGRVADMKHFGATIARYDLSSLYKMLFKLGSPEFVMKRVGVVYRTYIKGGGIAAADVRRGEAIVRLTDGSLPNYFCTHGVPGWFTAALELSGGKSVEVNETECMHAGARACVWRAKWT